MASIATTEVQMALASCDARLLRDLIREYEENLFAAASGLCSYMEITLPAWIAIFEGDEPGIGKFVDYLRASLDSHRIMPYIPLRALRELAILTSSKSYAELLEAHCERTMESRPVQSSELILWHVMSGLGIAYALLGKVEKAQAVISGIPAERADNGWIHTGLIAYLNGDYVDAIERMSRCPDAVPRTSSLLIIADVALADAKLRVCDPDRRREAVADLRRMLRLCRDKGLHLYSRYAQSCADRNGVSLDETAVTPADRPAGLTDREVEVINLVSSGKSNKEIAAELNISVRTVHRHVANILQKTGCGNRTEAARFAQMHGLTS